MSRRKKTNVRRRRKRKLIVVIIEIIILLLLIAAVYIYHRLDLINKKELDPNRVKVNEVTADTQATFEGYTTIAMFGLDNRTQGVYETGNSDVIMILNINNDTKEVNMVSVYRDTYLNVAGADEEPAFRKANSAYARGGPEQAVTMLNRNLDLEIDNYVAFDFSAVAKAIDILGGVDINIESEPERGYVNDYIRANNDILQTNAEEISSTGLQTLDGVQAVAYARVRYTSGGDLKRAERQRRVFSAMVQKAKKANIAQLVELINTIFPMIQTDLERNEIITMVQAMIGYDMAQSSGFPYDKKIDTVSKKIGSVVVPCDLESNVIQLHSVLFGTENYTPSSTVEEYTDIIIDNTGFTKESAEEDNYTGMDEWNGTGGTDSTGGTTTGTADSAGATE